MRQGAINRPYKKASYPHEWTDQNFLFCAHNHIIIKYQIFLYPTLRQMKNKSLATIAFFAVTILSIASVSPVIGYVVAKETFERQIFNNKRQNPVTNDYIGIALLHSILYFLFYILLFRNLGFHLTLFDFVRLILTALFFASIWPLTDIYLIFVLVLLICLWWGITHQPPGPKDSHQSPLGSILITFKPQTRSGWLQRHTTGL